MDLPDLSRFDLVIGTDTGVGKTIVSAFLVRKVAEAGGVPSYLKPVLTGISMADPESDPSRCVVLSGVADLRVECLYVFSDPIDPMTAAARAGMRIDPLRVRSEIGHRASSVHLVVEGSGGILSPFFPDGGGILSAFTARDLTRARVHLVSHPHLGGLSQLLIAIRLLSELAVIPIIHLVFRPWVDPFPLATSLNPSTLRALLPEYEILLHDCYPVKKT
ncbi:MAG: dethiobiotin synthase [Leptospirales bacterium]